MLRKFGGWGLLRRLNLILLMLTILKLIAIIFKMNNIELIYLFSIITLITYLQYTQMCDNKSVGGISFFLNLTEALFRLVVKIQIGWLANLCPVYGRWNRSQFTIGRPLRACSKNNSLNLQTSDVRVFVFTWNFGARHLLRHLTS